MFAPSQMNDAPTQQARASLQAYLRRVSEGAAKLILALALVWALSQIVWLICVVGGVGLGRAWHTGAFGRATGEVIKIAILAPIAWFGSRQALPLVYADLMERGVVTEARITQGPDFLLARVLGGALHVMVIDRLLGLLIPNRIANFDYSYQGTTHHHQAGFLYLDETTGADEQGAGALVLVDPQHPGARTWLVRRRDTASPR